MTPLTLKFAAPAQVGCGEGDLPLTPLVCAARWMLKQVQHDVGKVQHDVGGNASLRPLRLCVIPLMCHSRESGERSDRQVNPWTELSEKRFAQRHEGTKRLLPVFVSSCELKTYRVRKYKTMGSRFRGNDNVAVLGFVGRDICLLPLRSVWHDRC